MAKTEIPKSDFIPHPVGQHEGKICLLEDVGMKTTAFGEKHKVAVRVESTTAMMEDGQPFIVQQWYTLSGHPKSSLRKFRELIAGRALTDDEAYLFDTDDPMLLNKPVGFVIVHNEGKDGGTPYANIKAIWPLKAGLDKLRVEYFLQLIDLRTDKGQITVDAATKTGKWTSSSKCTPELLEEGIKKFEAALATANIPLPEMPTEVLTEGIYLADDIPF